MNHGLAQISYCTYILLNMSHCLQSQYQQLSLDSVQVHCAELI